MPMLAKKNFMNTILTMYNLVVTLTINKTTRKTDQKKNGSAIAKWQNRPLINEFKAVLTATRHAIRCPLIFHLH
jgi:hypothetical protein